MAKRKPVTENGNGGRYNLRPRNRGTTGSAAPDSAPPGDLPPSPAPPGSAPPSLALPGSPPPGSAPPGSASPGSASPGGILPGQTPPETSLPEPWIPHLVRYGDSPHNPSPYWLKTAFHPINGWLPEHLSYPAGPAPDKTQVKDWDKLSRDKLADLQALQINLYKAIHELETYAKPSLLTRALRSTREAVAAGDVYTVAGNDWTTSDIEPSPEDKARNWPTPELKRFERELQIAATEAFAFENEYVMPEKLKLLHDRFINCEDEILLILSSNVKILGEPECSERWKNPDMIPLSFVEDWFN